MIEVMDQLTSHTEEYVNPKALIEDYIYTHFKEPYLLHVKLTVGQTVELLDILHDAGFIGTRKMLYEEYVYLSKKGNTQYPLHKDTDKYTNFIKKVRAVRTVNK